MTLKVKAANSAVCTAQHTHLGFSWSQCCVPVHLCTHANAHSQKWNRRNPGPYRTLQDLTGTNQSLQMPAEATYRLSSHSNTAIQSLALVICSIHKGLCHSNFYRHNPSVLTREYLHEKPFK